MTNYGARPTYSIVMPAFNEERYIGEQLQSIVNQSRQPDEIIVVDDHSTDATASIIDRFAAVYPHVKAFHLSENVGVTRAVMHGLNNATGYYVSPISANDLVPGGVFEVGMGLLESFPGAAFFVGDPASAGPTGQVFWRRLGYADGPCFIAPRQVVHLPFAQNPLHSAGLWVRRDLLLALPGWLDIGYASDRWFLHVLALRHGFCYAPIPAYIMREHDRPALAVERRLQVERKVLDLLDSPAYADVRAALIASGVFAADGWGHTFLRVVMERYDALRGHHDPPINESIGREVLGLTPAVPAPRPAERIDGSKTNAVLALAAELVEHPELGRAYAQTFGAQDDVTLVLYAPDQETAVITSQLEQSVPELLGETGPDVMLLAVGEQYAQDIASRCQAVLTRSNAAPVSAHLQRFGASDMALLKQLLI